MHVFGVRHGVSFGVAPALHVPGHRRHFFESLRIVLHRLVSGAAAQARVAAGARRHHGQLLVRTRGAPGHVQVGAAIYEQKSESLLVRSL